MKNLNDDITKKGIEPIKGIKNAEEEKKKSNEELTYEQKVALSKAINANRNNISIFDTGLSTSEGIPLSSPTDSGAKYLHSKYDPVGPNLGDYTMANDIRGREQPWYAQLGAGLAKGVLLAGTTFADGWAGLTYGVGKSIATRDASQLFNNEISTALNDFNRYMEEVLPNYRTDEEKEMSVLRKFGTMNFWADGFLKNIGFTVGAMYSGSSLLGLLKNIPKLAKMSSMAAKIVGSTFSAFNEGRIEAHNMARDFMELNTRQLQDASRQRYQEILNDPTLSEEQKQQEIFKLRENYDKQLMDLQDRANTAGIATLLANTAFLSIDNFSTFGKIFAHGWKYSENMFTDMIGRDAAKKYLLKELTKKKAIATGLKHGLVEGNEELFQAFISEAAGLAQTPDSPDSYYKALTDPNYKLKTKRNASAIIEGLANSYGDGSRYEEFAVGALTGLLGTPTFGRSQNSSGSTYLGKNKMVGISGGIFGELTNAKFMNAQAKDLVDGLNDYYEKKLKNIVNYNAQSEAFTDATAGYSKENNQFEYHNYKDNEDFNALARYSRAGRLKDLMEEIDNDYENYTKEQLEDIAKNTSPNVTYDAEGNVITHDEEGKPITTGWRNPDGTLMSDTEEGREKMREQLIEKREKVKKGINSYIEVLEEIRGITGDQYTNEETAELAWLKWKSNRFKERYNDVKGGNSKNISSAISGLNKEISDLETELAKEGISEEKKKEIQTKINSFKKLSNVLKDLRENDEPLELASKISKNFDSLLYLESLRKFMAEKGILDSDGLDKFIESIDDIFKIASLTNSFNKRYEEFKKTPDKIRKKRQKEEEENKEAENIINNINLNSKINKASDNDIINDPDIDGVNLDELFGESRERVEKAQDIKKKTQEYIDTISNLSEEEKGKIAERVGIEVEELDDYLGSLVEGITNNQKNLQNLGDNVLDTTTEAMLEAFLKSPKYDEKTPDEVKEIADNDLNLISNILEVIEEKIKELKEEGDKLPDSNKGGEYFSGNPSLDEIGDAVGLTEDDVNKAISSEEPINMSDEDINSIDNKKEESAEPTGQLTDTDLKEIGDDSVTETATQEEVEKRKRKNAEKEKEEKADKKENIKKEIVEDLVNSGWAEEDVKTLLNLISHIDGLIKSNPKQQARTIIKGIIASDPFIKLSEKYNKEDIIKPLVKYLTDIYNGKKVDIKSLLGSEENTKKEEENNVTYDASDSFDSNEVQVDTSNLNKKESTKEQETENNTAIEEVDKGNSRDQKTYWKDTTSFVTNPSYSRSLSRTERNTPFFTTEILNKIYQYASTTFKLKIQIVGNYLSDLGTFKFKDSEDLKIGRNNPIHFEVHSALNKEIREQFTNIGQNSEIDKAFVILIVDKDGHVLGDLPTPLDGERVFNSYGNKQDGTSLADFYNDVKAEYEALTDSEKQANDGKWKVKLNGKEVQTTITKKLYGQVPYVDTYSTLNTVFGNGKFKLAVQGKNGAIQKGNVKGTVLSPKKSKEGQPFLLISMGTKGSEYYTCVPFIMDTFDPENQKGTMYYSKIEKAVENILAKDNRDTLRELTKYLAIKKLTISRGILYIEPWSGEARTFNIRDNQNKEAFLNALKGIPFNIDYNSINNSEYNEMIGQIAKVNLPIKNKENTINPDHTINTKIIINPLSKQDGKWEEKGVDISFNKEEKTNQKNTNKEINSQTPISGVSSPSSKFKSFDEYLEDNEVINNLFLNIVDEDAANSLKDSLKELYKEYSGDGMFRDIAALEAFLKEEIIADLDDIDALELTSTIKRIYNKRFNIKYRLINEGESKKEWNEKEELAWLKKVLPQLSNEEHLRILEAGKKIATSDDKEAYGSFKNNLITLTKNAARGTLYHETFHSVVNSLLNEKEYSNLFKEGAKLYNTSNTLEIEEKLAEDFRKYVQYEEKPVIGTIVKIFRMLKHLIQSILGNELYINKMFYNINNGKLKDRIVQESKDDITRYRIVQSTLAFERYVKDLAAFNTYFENDNVQSNVSEYMNNYSKFLDKLKETYDEYKDNEDIKKWVKYNNNTYKLLKGLISNIEDIDNITVVKNDYKNRENFNGIHKKATGLYFPFLNKISFDKNINIIIRPIIVAHEIIHSITYNKYYIDPNFKTKVDNIYEYVKQYMNEENKNLQGFTNALEMIAEVVNPQFQEVLLSIPSKNPNKKSVLKEILDLIKEVFNIDKNKRTALDDLIDLIKEEGEVITYDLSNLSKINEFNKSDINTSKVDIEEITDLTLHKGCKTLRFYVKDKHDKLYFELVKDKDFGQYSVYTVLKSYDTTPEERMTLFKELYNAIPEGAIVSTWGPTTSAKVEALNFLCNEMNVIGKRTVKDFNTNEDIRIPIYQKKNSPSVTDNVGLFNTDNDDIRYRLAENENEQNEQSEIEKIRQYHKNKLTYENLLEEDKNYIKDRGISKKEYDNLTDKEKEVLFYCK